VTTYREYLEETAPPWGDEFWRRLHSVLGVLHNTYAEGATQATRARFIAEAPADALDYIAEERGIERGALETLAQFRERLEQSFEAYQYAGTEKAIKDQLAAVGYSGVVIYEDSDWTWDSSAGTNWWRFWVVFPEGTLLTTAPPAYWGSGTFGTFAWGGSITIAQYQQIRRIVDKWKPAHAQLVNIIVIHDGELWGDGHVWGSGTWGGSASYYG
jgi:hypothetical protein